MEQGAKMLDDYLLSSEYIDWQTDSVMAKAKQLADSANNPITTAKNCFEFVRDQIKHSWDFQLNPVTCKASEVLEHGTGYCYAKSHLLAALLRANGLPAGLCYQRLTVSDNQPPFCLHGLNAVYLPEYAWYRIDARGNKAGVEAEFSPPDEKLAFPIQVSGEADLTEVYAEPLDLVITCLQDANDYRTVADNLPDIDI